MRLLDDLAELTRLEVGAARPTTPGRVPSTRWRVEMRERLAPLAESAGIELDADVAPALVVASRRADRAAHRQPRPQRVARAAARRRLAHHDVRRARGRDGRRSASRTTGPACPAAELAQVFDRFYRGVLSARSGQRQRARADDRPAASSRTPAARSPPSTVVAQRHAHRRTPAARRRRQARAASRPRCRRDSASRAVDARATPPPRLRSSRGAPPARAPPSPRGEPPRTAAGRGDVAGPASRRCPAREPRRAPRRISAAGRRRRRARPRRRSRRPVLVAA